MRDSEEGRTHSYGDGCEPPHADPDWGLPHGWLAEDAMHREHAKNLRREADELGRRYWAARADHSLTPAECDALECSRWSCIVAAAAIERQLRDLPSG